MNKIPIGGYFSLELPWHEEYHKNALRLNSGRNCLEYVLRARNYKKVYIPYYTCSVVLEPFKKLKVEYVFYHIDINFEIIDSIILNENEALLYTNYFGLKQRYVEKLVKKYGTQIIIDNTQAFFAPPISGIDTFNTCRKFFGVPDGAYLYTDNVLYTELEQDKSWNRMSFLLKRIDIGAEAGYPDFRDQSEKLVGQPIKLMSNLTQRLMQSIDYVAVAVQRRTNYLILQKSLGESNQINLNLEDDAVPMVYPYMCDDKGLRELLINSKIFVAQYWPNVLKWVCDGSIEMQIAKELIPLPIDQRYGVYDLKQLLNIIKNVKR